MLTLSCWACSSSLSGDARELGKTACCQPTERSADSLKSDTRCGSRISSQPCDARCAPVLARLHELAQAGRWRDSVCVAEQVELRDTWLHGLCPRPAQPLQLSPGSPVQLTTVQARTLAGRSRVAETQDSAQPSLALTGGMLLVDASFMTSPLQQGMRHRERLRRRQANAHQYLTPRPGWQPL